MTLPRIKKHIALVLLFCVSAATRGQSQTYATAIKNSFATIDADEFQYFHWLGYPLDEWGIGSIASSRNHRLDNRRRLCPTFRCFGISRPADSEHFVNFSDKFVNVAKGTQLQFTNSSEEEQFLRATAPLLFGKLGIGGGTSSSSGVKLNLNSGQLYYRTMNKPEVVRWILGLKDSDDPLQQEIYTLAQRKRIVMVLADVLVENFTLDVQLDKTRASDLAVKLGALTSGPSSAAKPADVECIEFKSESNATSGSAAPPADTPTTTTAAAPPASSSGAEQPASPSAGIGVSRATSSCSKYRIHTTEPLVIGRYYRNQTDWKMTHPLFGNVH